ncbi:MAG TPA: helix-turn-helix transcriptional regulator [Tepidisphaeraceae bacterium]|nr:helix-turn-helix transcriptional regulator [Tepidisphaeraceae bacterium]
MNAIKPPDNSWPVARRVGGVAVERPRDDPPRGVPIALRTAQHVFVSRGRFEPAWSKRIVLVEWAISGEAAMSLGGAQRLSFGPGEVAIYLPSIPMRFWAVAPVSEMCWFSLDGPSADPFAMELDLRPGVYPYGPAPVEQIHEMMEGLKDHTIQGRRRASLLAIRMLYQLADVVRTPEVPSVASRAQQLIEQEFADPELSVASIAERLNYHRVSLSRLFHRHTGTTLIDYLTQVRLQEARALLQHTPDKIAQVARKCGFREPSYFCRWLRKHTGLPPGQLRSAPPPL